MGTTLSVSAAVGFAADTYKLDPSWTGSGLNQSIHVRATSSNGLLVLAFRGSVAPWDWAIDFAALPDIWHKPKDHPSLGPIHAGFLEAASSVIGRCALAVTGRPYVTVGHSLGGALAFLVGAMLATEDGMPPTAMFGFAPPRVGMGKFIEQTRAFSPAAWRYGNDPVVDVPLTIPPLLDYRQEPNMTAIGVPMHDPLGCHHIANYVAALASPIPQQELSS